MLCQDAPGGPRRSCSSARSTFFKYIFLFQIYFVQLDTVEHLVKKYGMTNIDAMITFDKFFKNYPSGEITKEEFMEEYKDNVMAEAFFKMFDEDGNGTLRFDIIFISGLTLALTLPFQLLRVHHGQNGPAPR